jgi:hypothetical protein
MALPLREFSAAGVAISNELVRCNEPVTVGATTYYRGILTYTCNGNIYGNDSASYGVWDGSAKSGNRKLALIAGYPASADEVSIDLWNGYVYSTVEDDFYIYYLAHEPVKHHLGDFSVEIQNVLPAGQAVTICRKRWPWPVKFGFVLIDIEGGFPTAAATLTMSNGTEIQNFTVDAAAGGAAQLVELSAAFKVNYGETLTVSTADVKDMVGGRIEFKDL